MPLPSSGVPAFFRRLGSVNVTVIRAEGTDDEEHFEIEAHVQAKQAMFAVDAPVYDGDTIEVPDPRGGTSRFVLADVAVHNVGTASVRHITAQLAKSAARPTPALRRLKIENLHPEVIRLSSDLYVDGHFSQAVFEACKGLEGRVRAQSGIDASGRDLMTRAFSDNQPPINLATEAGRSGRDEQEGLRFIFMGVAQGIRNPKGHAEVRQEDPQRALEYLALVSVLHRRLDDAEEGASSPGLS